MPELKHGNHAGISFAEVGSELRATATSEFTGLTDTPDDYTRRADLRVAVNAGETAVNFVGSPVQHITTHDLYSDNDPDTFLSGPGHSSNKLVTFNGNQYATWVDDLRNVFIGKRVVGTAEWTVQDTGADISEDNSHRTPAIGIDPNGFIHLIYGAHTDNIRYRVSSNAEDITSWGAEQTSITGIRSTSFTYPNFVALGDGTLALFYRDGVSGDGTLVMATYNESTTSWTEVDVLINPTANGAPYWTNPPAVDDSGVIHLAWTHYESGSSSREDLMYMKSADKGATWTKADGTSITLPVTSKTDADLIDDSVSISTSDAAFPGTRSITVDANGYPVVAYTKKTGSVEAHLFVAYHDGTSWTIEQVTTEPVVPADLGSVPAGRYGRPYRVFRAGASVLIVGHNRPHGSEAVAFEAMSDDYTTWRRFVLDHMPLYTFHPPVDAGAAKDGGTVTILIGQSVEESDSLSGSLETAPLRVLEFEAPERGHVVPEARMQQHAYDSDGDGVVNAAHRVEQEGVVVTASSGTSHAIDCAAGTIHEITLDANCTFSFTNVPTGGFGLTLELIQDGTGNRTITWPASVTWAGGTAPTLTTGAGGVDIVTLYTPDGGTTWRGFEAGLDFS